MAAIFLGNTMRQPLVIGNWKMHGSLSANAELLQALNQQLSADSTVAVAVCPPALYLSSVAAALEASSIQLGAQNVCAEAQASGAYTGEVAAAMLAEFNTQFGIIGHSERRQYYAESDALVAQKFVQLQQAGIAPVLCVGENLDQREAGETLAFVAAQIQAVIDVVGIQALAQAVIAYEPIWAIGTGKTATPEQAQEVHAHIRQLLADQDETIAAGMQLLYGGSVKADNAAELFAMQDIDGALVGGAALKAADFSAICKAAE